MYHSLPVGSGPDGQYGEEPEVEIRTALTYGNTLNWVLVRRAEGRFCKCLRTRFELLQRMGRRHL